MGVNKVYLTANKCSEISFAYEQYPPTAGGNISTGLELFPARITHNHSDCWAEAIELFLENDRIKGQCVLNFDKNIDINRKFFPETNLIRIVFDERLNNKEPYEFCYIDLRNIDVVDIVEDFELRKIFIRFVMKGFTRGKKMFNISPNQKIWLERYGCILDKEAKKDDLSDEEKKMIECMLVNNSAALTELWRFNHKQQPDFINSYDDSQRALFNYLSYVMDVDPKYVQVLKDFKVSYHG